MDDEGKRLQRLLAGLTPQSAQDLVRVAMRAKHISKRVMTELPEEVESLVKQGILPGSQGWWLIMYLVAATEMGVDLLHLKHKGAG